MLLPTALAGNDQVEQVALLLIRDSLPVVFSHNPLRHNLEIHQIVRRLTLLQGLDESVLKVIADKRVTQPQRVKSLTHLVGALDDEPDVLAFHGLAAAVREDALFDEVWRLNQRRAVGQFQVNVLVDMVQREPAEIGKVLL